MLAHRKKVAEAKESSENAKGNRKTALLLYTERLTASSFSRARSTTQSFFVCIFAAKRPL